MFVCLCVNVYVAVGVLAFAVCLLFVSCLLFVVCCSLSLLLVASGLMLVVVCW